MSARRPTFSHGAEWDQLARNPTLPKVVTCALCGGLRYTGSGPHSPHWVDGRQVDCVGREVRP